MTSRTEMTDHDLLKSYVDTRDVDCLSSFLARYQDSLMRFVTNYLHDDLAAQDIVQETFLRVARHPRRLLAANSCHNWLLAVARNLSVDHLRKVIRRRKHLERYAAQVHADEAGTVGFADAAVPLERQEIQARVRAEIQSLKPRLRELVLLKVQEGKSYREIADITGLSATNVGYLLHQAMKTLGHRLRDLKESLP